MVMAFRKVVSEGDAMPAAFGIAHEDLAPETLHEDAYSGYDSLVTRMAM